MGYAPLVSVRCLVSVAILLSALPAWAQLWPSDPKSIEARLLHPTSGHELHRAAALVEHLPVGDAAEIVLKGLASKNEEVRVVAAGVAGRLRIAPAAAAVQRWLKDPSDRMRLAALEVLDEVPRAGTGPAIARLLADTSPAVRASAASALASLGNDEAPPVLVAHLDDPEPNVQLVVIRALARIGSSSAVVPLMGAAQSEDDRVREAALRALGSIGAAEALPALTGALTDARPAVRAAAVRAIERVGPAAALTALVALLEREQDEGVRVTAFDALATVGGPTALETLIEALRTVDGSHWEQRRLVQALSGAGEEVVPAVRRCVEHAVDSPTALRCAQALVALGDSSAGDILIAAADAGVISSAAVLTALPQPGTPRSLSYALRRVEDPDRGVRLEALRAVTRMLDSASREGRAVEPLRQALHAAHSTEERIAAIGALGRTRDPRATVELVPLLGVDVPSSIRLASVQALARVPGERRDRALVALLTERGPAVRGAAAWALREGFGQAGFSELIHLYEGPGTVDRELVGLALGGVRVSKVRNPHTSRIQHLLRGETRARRDSLLEALFWEGSAVSSKLALSRAVSRSPADRMKVAELAERLPGSRELLRRLMLSDPSVAVRANAAWSLGAVGAARDIPDLLRLVRGRAGIVSGNAVAAIGRIAARHGVESGPLLCPLLSHAVPQVRVNALAGLRDVGAGCGVSEELTALHQDPSRFVRSAAATLIADRGGSIEPNRLRALVGCAEQDTHGDVASACLAEPRPGVAAGEPDELLVFVVPPGREQPVPGAAYAIMLPSGYIRAGVADRRGAVLVTLRGTGMVRLLSHVAVSWSSDQPGDG